MTEDSPPRVPAAREPEALTRRPGEMEALFRAFPDLLILLDSRGTVVDYKAGSAPDPHEPAEGFLGKGIEEVLPPRAAAQFGEAARKARETAALSTVEYVMPTPQGDETYEARVIPLPQDHLLAVVRNVTEKRQLETRLYLSQKMEAVGRLAGGIAHDFNNILNVIMGFAALIAKRLPEGDALQRHAQEIQKAADRAADLTRQLLAFSRQQVLQPTVLDPNALLANFERMLRRVIGEDVDLETRLGEGVGRIHADPGQIEQVILNLVINARDAMPGGGRLVIETRNVELGAQDADPRVEVVPGTYVLLTVADTGAGMDARTREHIFEPFFTTKEQGTGLGLSTAYGIVKQSGGYIFADSAVDRGSTFRVYFPLVLEPPAASPPLPSASLESRGFETILVVEDEAALRDVIQEMLEEQGYRVVLAGSGDEALRLASEQALDVQLLLTDIVMPGMNGRELAKRLQGRLSGLKVLYMSGYTFDGPLREGVEAQAVFLPKPFTAEALTRKVRAVLDEGT